jgi:hypothetical protein
MALIVQNTGQWQGNIGSTLYQLAANPSLKVFHDVTLGNNSVPGMPGYSAGPGWDPVTGLGSVDGNALVTNWPGSQPTGTQITLSTGQLSFGNQSVGSTSASQTVTVTNSGTTAVSIATVLLTGVNTSDFPTTSTCANSVLAAGQKCTITVAFKPAASGSRTSAVSITDNAANSPQVIQLTGTGLAPVTTISFTNQEVTKAVPAGTCTLPSASTSFLTTDGSVYVFFDASVTGSDTLSSDWLAPNGDVITGHTWGTLTAGSYCFWGSMDISSPPPGHFGAWQARVYNNGKQIFTLPFTVSSPTVPAGQTVLPQFVFGGGWYTALYFTNLSGNAVSFSVNFISDAGLPLNVPGIGTSSTVNLAAGGTAIIEARNVGNVAVGYAMFSLPSGVTGYGVFRESISGQPDQEAVVPFSSATTTANTLIWDETSVSTGVAIVNPTANSIQIAITARDTSGNTIGNSTLSLPPNGKTEAYLSSLPGLAGIAGKRGSAQFVAQSGSVAVLGLRFNGSALTSIPTTTNNVVSNSISALLPQFVFGGGWYSALYFTNLTGNAASFPISFLNGSGAPLIIPGVGGSSTQVNLNAYGTTVIEAPNAGDLSDGYANFTLPSGVYGYGVFRQSIAGLPDQEAVVPFSAASSGSNMLTWDETSFMTGVAIVASSLGGATVNVTLWDTAGNSIGTSSLSLPPNGKTATFLQTLPGLAGMVGKRGLAQFTASTGGVSVLGLRFNQTAFTSIPAKGSSSFDSTGAPAAIQIVSGDAQTAIVNQTFAAPLVVRVTDAQGNAVSGTALKWTAVGSGSLINPAAFTNSQGQGSANVQAGGSAGTVSITVTAGSISTQFTLKIAPASTASVSTALTSNTNGIVNGSCVTPPSVNSFTTSASQVWAYFVVTGANVGDSGKITWIRPDGTVYATYNVTAPAANICLSYYININGSPAASYPGTWTVQIVWGQSNTLLSSLKFALGLSVSVNTALVSNTSGVVNGSCVTPPSVTNFTTVASQIWVYYLLSGITVGDTGKINWIRPDGTVYATANITATLTSECFSYYIPISGAPAASYPGTWTIQLLWGASNTVLSSLNFVLSPATNAKVTTAVTSGTSGIVNGACVTPPSVTSFTTTVSQMWVYFVVSGANVGDSGKINWIRPGGTVYATANITATLTNECFSYYIPINGTTAASYPGTWTIQLVWGQSNTVLSSLNFTLSPTGANVTAAVTSNTSGIVNNTCVIPPAVTNFSRSASQMWVYFSVSGATVGDTAKINWIRPDGTVYATANLTVGFSSECFSYNIAINGAPAASYPGTWTVQLVLGQSNALLSSLSFNLS